MNSWFGTYQKLASRVVPDHQHSQRLYHEWLNQALAPGSSWLDLGCGHQILPSWVKADEKGMVARCRRAVGIDLDLAGLKVNRVIQNRVMGALAQLPFADEIFDLVTANMVVEHLAEPVAVLGEIRRVLRPGGRFLFHTPNRNAPAVRIASHTPNVIKRRLIRLLESRAEPDIFPTYYRMNNVSIIRKRALAAGFRMERLEQRSSVAVTAVFGPLALPELLFMRALSWKRLEDWRSDILGVMQRP